MDQAFFDRLQRDTAALASQGLYKTERVLTSPQQPVIDVVTESGETRSCVNFCANNYLGLANHPAMVEAAHAALDQAGYGMASVRFICGTQRLHTRLERQISHFLGTDDTMLYSSCFDANGGLFEALLDEQDAVISDELNHASIIDGVRLCKAKRLRYKNNDMADLQSRLREASECRVKLVVTDGVFSMDGTVATLADICRLGQAHQAVVVVDDSHATGFLGAHGRGTVEHCGVEGQVDVITSTLGKALGGASGGFTSGRKEIIAWLRQRSRPYLFSNSLAPPVAGAAIKALELLAESDTLRQRLRDNSQLFRQELGALGFDLVPGEHPIIPVMLGDAQLAQQMADRLLDEGVYVIGFSYPVVPKGKARIRTQMSAAHTPKQLERAVAAFASVGRELAVIR